MALTRWKLSFAADGRGHEAKIYFDYELDTLFFPGDQRDVDGIREMMGEKETWGVGTVFIQVGSEWRTSGAFRESTRVVKVLMNPESAIWRRGGKMISFVSVKQKVGLVKMKIVEEGGEAWDRSTLQYTRKEQRSVISDGNLHWKKTWRAWLGVVLESKVYQA